jgi:hypothetical protein
MKNPIVTNGRVFTPEEFTEVVKKHEIKSPKNVELLRKHLCNPELASEVVKFFEDGGVINFHFKGEKTYKFFEE